LRGGAGGVAGGGKGLKGLVFRKTQLMDTASLKMVLALQDIARLASPQLAAGRQQVAALQEAPLQP